MIQGQTQVNIKENKRLRHVSTTAAVTTTTAAATTTTVAATTTTAAATTTTAAATTTTAAATTTVAKCAAGWQHSGTSCYKLIAEQATFS